MSESVPKFSILLPTRNRAKLALDAIETVRQQPYNDWEVIVSDNNSIDELDADISKLGDDRIKYSRSERFLPVTENWNRALSMSSGTYVVMLGDDDGLVPGYFSKVLAAMEYLSEPDLLYHGAYHFAFPGTFAEVPNGRLTDVTNFYEILRGSSTASLLAPNKAAEIAHQATRFHAAYAFNMQHFVFQRDLIKRFAIHGDFFQGAFPDFYLANLCMLEADRIGIVPQPLTIIGISPKSYGYFHFNKKDIQGRDFLSGDKCHLDGVRQEIVNQIVPGTNMLTSWMTSVSRIVEKNTKATVTIDVTRYRYLQIISNALMISSSGPNREFISQMWPLLSLKERLFAGLLVVMSFGARCFGPKIERKWQNLINKRAAIYSEPPDNLPKAIEGRYNNMVEVFNGLQQEQLK